MEWEEKTTDKPIRQVNQSLIQQIFTVLSTKNMVVKKTDGNPFPVNHSSWEFWVLVLTLSLIHCVTWVSHFIFLGLNFSYKWQIWEELCQGPPEIYKFDWASLFSPS